MISEKACTKCGGVKPISEFYPKKRESGSIRPASQCKSCTLGRLYKWAKENPEIKNARQRAYYLKNIDKYRAYGRAQREKNKDKCRASCRAWAKRNREKVYATNCFRKYGVTYEQYLALVEAQGGCCAVCGIHKSDCNGRRLSVDHDHSTGKVRGALCPRCNVGIGHFREDISAMRKAADYLERFK